MQRPCAGPCRGWPCPRTSSASSLWTVTRGVVTPGPGSVGEVALRCRGRGSPRGSPSRRPPDRIARVLDQLDQHPAGVLGVDEVDAGARRCRGAARRRAAGTPSARSVSLSASRSSTGRRPGGCPGPLRSRNFAIVESAVSGASSWTHDPLSPTAIIASRTPWSSLVSSWTQRIPNVACVVGRWRRRGRRRRRRRGRSGSARGSPRGLSGSAAGSVRGGRCSWLDYRGSLVVTRPVTGDLEGAVMSGTTIGHRRRGAHAHGPPARLAQGLLRRRPGRCRDQGRARARRCLARAGRLRDHGPGAARRVPASARHARPRSRRGIPMTTPSLTINKVCLSGHRRHRARRPAHPGGRVRDRRRGWQESMTQAPHLLANGRTGTSTATRPSSTPWPRRACTDAFDSISMGAARPSGYNDALRPDPRGAGRVRGALAPAGGGRAEERAVRRRDRAGRDPAAQGRPDRLRRGRGHPRRHDRRDAWPAEAGVRRRRHDHGRLVVADLRRCLRRRRHEQGQGRGARAHLARRDRRARRRRRTGQHRCTSSRPTPSRRPAPAKGIAPADLDLVELNEAFAAVGIVSASASSGSPRTRSTSTAGPSRSVTRSA